MTEKYENEKYGITQDAIEEQAKRDEQITFPTTINRTIAEKMFRVAGKWVFDGDKQICPLFDWNPYHRDDHALMAQRMLPVDKQAHYAVQLRRLVLWERKETWGIAEDQVPTETLVVWLIANATADQISRAIYEVVKDG